MSRNRTQGRWTQVFVDVRRGLGDLRRGGFANLPGGNDSAAAGNPDSAGSAQPWPGHEKPAHMGDRNAPQGEAYTARNAPESPLIRVGYRPERAHARVQGGMPRG